MDLSKRRPSPNRSLVFPDHNPSDTRKRMGSQKESFDESDENSQPSSLREFTARWEEPPSTKRFTSATVSSASKRNHEASPDAQLAALLQNNPRVRSSGDRNLMVSSTSPNQVPYHPVTNYLSPRPQFLRYDPNRRREFIQRMEGTGSGDDESSSTSSSSSQEGVTQEIAEDGSDSEDGGDEDEVMGERLHCSTVVCKLLLLLWALMFSACCISSMNSPTAHYLQESGGFLGSHLMMGNHSLFYGNSLESLVGSPEICSIVHPRNLVSQDDGIEYKPLVLDDLINREEMEGKKSDSVDSTTGHLMIPDKLAERVDTEVGLVDDDIGLVTENEENVSKEKKSHDISDSTLGDLALGDLLVPEKLAEGVDREDDQLNDGIGYLLGNQDDLLEGEESCSQKSDSILGDSATGDLLIPDKLPESVDVGEYGLNGGSRLATGNDKMISVNGSLGGNVLRDEEDYEEAVECQEFLVEKQYGRANTSTAADDIVPSERPELVTESSSQVPQTNIVSGIPSTDEIKEATEPSTVSEFKVKWELSHIWICSLTAVFGLLIALYKYFTRSRQSALLESPSCSDSAVEGKISSAVLMNEVAESKGLNEGWFSGVEATVLETSYQDLERRVAEISRTPVQSAHSSDERKELYGTHLPTAEVLRTPVLSRHSSDEHEELYSSRPPTVELLGEFSFVDMKNSQTGSNQTERNGSKGSPLRQYESKGSKRKCPSPSAYKVLPSSSVESVSNGSFSAQNKSLRKQVSGLRQYERKGSKEKSPSPSAYKVLPSSLVESVSNGSFSAQNKSLRKQDSSDRQKTVATPTTPLRRSVRLRPLHYQAELL